MINPFTIEACVESAEQAIRAENEGADRIELCSNLAADGLSPSSKLVKTVISSVKIPVYVMVRPRPGSFYYTKKELEQMHRTIFSFQSIGVSGIVTGVLDFRNMPDINILNTLIRSAEPLPVTFHKAIDLAYDLHQAVNVLSQYSNVKAVLTSGGKPDAWEGRHMLRQLVESYGNRLEIIAAGKITAFNLQEIHRAVGSSAYHGRNIV